MLCHFICKETETNTKNFASKEVEANFSGDGDGGEKSLTRPQAQAKRKDNRFFC